MLKTNIYKYFYYCSIIFALNISAAHSGVKSNLTYQKVNALEVKHLLKSDPNTVLIHSLSKIEFLQQHIPNSINIPTDHMDTTIKLPKDKATPLIFYCMGKRCKYSENSSKKAIKKGYERVYWFQAGIPEWRSFGYDMYENQRYKKIKVVKMRPDEVRIAIEEKDVYILDVRPLWLPTDQGYLQGSVNIPLLFIEDYLPNFPLNRPIIVTDVFMKQSGSAAKYLIAEGYNVLGVLRGGIKLWNKKNFPTVTKSEIKTLNPKTLVLD